MCFVVTRRFETLFPQSSTIVGWKMNKVKCCYFTSIISTIVVLSLLIVVVYKLLEVEVLFTEKFPCSDPDGSTPETCLCATGFCVNKCCAWGARPLSPSGDNVYLCIPYETADQQRRTFDESLQYYTSTTDRVAKQNRNNFKIYIDFLTSDSPEGDQTKRTYVAFDDVSLFQNGSLSLSPVEYWSPSKYCLDTSSDSSTELNVFFTEYYESNESNDTNDGPEIESNNYLVSPLLSVSVFFFVLTLLIYAVLSSLQTLSVKCLMCYLLCMSVADAGLLYFDLRDIGAEYYEETCATVGKLLITYLIS